MKKASLIKLKIFFWVLLILTIAVGVIFSQYPQIFQNKAKEIEGKDSLRFRFVRPTKSVKPKSSTTDEQKTLKDALIKSTCSDLNGSCKPWDTGCSNEIIGKDLCPKGFICCNRREKTLQQEIQKTDCYQLGYSCIPVNSDCPGGSTSNKCPTGLFCCKGQ